jgi:inorganic triphosphatase YgiF
MEAEIELKLFFPENAREALVSLLDSLPHSEPKGSQHLSNCYYDTPDLQLRHWDMGLRIRGCDGHFEQTIKTAGSVIGGVHSRPEYNIDIDQAKVNLTLFPGKIWPTGADLERIEQQLSALFSTDFTRMKWHIYLEESLVEVALDIGTISANGSNETICELEFELLAGKTQALLILGERVARQIPARLGRASKAQRGYRLAAMAGPTTLEPLAFIQLDQVSDLKQAFMSILSTGLERWQLLEAMLLESSDRLEALPLLSYRLRASVRLIRCLLSQFELLDTELLQELDCIERHLEYVELGLSLTEIFENDGALLVSLPQAPQMRLLARQALVQLAIPSALNAMLADTCYGHLQLKLVSLLFACREGRIDVGKGRELQRFADKMQEAAWQHIGLLMPSEADLNDYQSFARALDDSILT